MTSVQDIILPDKTFHVVSYSFYIHVLLNLADHFYTKNSNKAYFFLSLLLLYLATVLGLLPFSLLSSTICLFEKGWVKVHKR